MQPDEQERRRNEARASARDGLAALARAFNHCDNGELAYRYAADVQARFVELATELVVLVESGAIEPNPAHGRYLMFKAARDNATLQSLIRKAVRPAGRGAPRRDVM